MKQDQKSTTSATENTASTLRTKFCDSDGRNVESGAQRAATAECKYPQQTRVAAQDSFESFGLN